MITSFLRRTWCLTNNSTRKRARSKSLRVLFCTHFAPGLLPFSPLSGWSFGGKSPKILPSLTPKTSPSEADSSSQNTQIASWFLPVSTLKSPWKAPLSCPAQVMIPPGKASILNGTAWFSVWILPLGRSERGRKQGRRQGNCRGERGYEGCR